MCAEVCACDHVPLMPKPDLQFHLDMGHMILPYFAVSGHYHYQKSVYLYLQTMSQIHMTHSGLHKLFINGLHVIRRSDHFWPSLSPNLVEKTHLQLRKILSTYVPVKMLMNLSMCTRLLKLEESLSVEWVIS